MEAPTAIIDKEVPIAALLERIEAPVARNGASMAENARLAARVSALDVKALDAPHPAGLKLDRMTRAHHVVFVQNSHLEAIDIGSERALRPCAVHRRIIDGLRQEWGAPLEPRSAPSPRPRDDALMTNCFP